MKLRHLNPKRIEVKSSELCLRSMSNTPSLDSEEEVEEFFGGFVTAEGQPQEEQAEDQEAIAPVL